MSLVEDDNDQFLTQLLASGNERAFERIYHKYASNLFRFACKNIASHEDCEEIIQEIFESLWRRREELAKVESMEAYLFTMVKYRIIRHFRHESVKSRYAEHFRLFELLYEDSASEIDESTSIQNRILAAISELPARCQEAMRLRLLDNMSNDEIAAAMNLKKDTVENYIVNAVRHLRQTFNRVDDRSQLIR